MITLAIVLFVVVVIEAALLGVGLGMLEQSDKRSSRLWQHIENLEHDKRALTESLCRAEGKPVNLLSTELIPSEGWFDGKERIVKVSQL